MSWQQYVDENMVGTGYVNEAAIIGVDGSTWAVSGGSTLTAEQAVNIASYIQSAAAMQASGMTVGANKFFTIRAEDNNIFWGKKGPLGICVAKAGTCILIGTYPEGVSQQDCNQVVEGMRDYLVGLGY